MHFFFFLFFIFYIKSLDLYIQSNYTSLPSDGLTTLSPLSTLDSGLNTLLFQTIPQTNNIYLLPSPITYVISLNCTILQNMTISGFLVNFPLYLSFDGSFNIPKSISFSIKFLILTRSTSNPIESMFSLSSDSIFILNSIKITSFGGNVYVNQFIKGFNATIILSNMNIYDNNFDNFHSFIEPVV